MQVDRSDHWRLICWRMGDLEEVRDLPGPLVRLNTSDLASVFADIGTMSTPEQSLVDDLNISQELAPSGTCPSDAEAATHWSSDPELYSEDRFADGAQLDDGGELKYSATLDQKILCAQYAVDQQQLQSQLGQPAVVTGQAAVEPVETRPANSRRATPVTQVTAHDGIPSLTSWPGEYNFRVSVREPASSPAGKQIQYVYSQPLGKLYVNLCVPVPLEVSVLRPAGSEQLVQQLYVRCMPVHPESQHINQPVTRCPAHRLPTDPSNRLHRNREAHVLRADHPLADYQTFGVRSRRSVVVPYCEPGPDSAAQTLLISFACMNSCVGGMDRRQLAVVFFLEDSRGQVLGRQFVHVKVCKCPHRDRRNEEKKSEQRRRTLSDGDAARQTPAKRPKTEPQSQPTEQQLYLVPTYGRAEYEMLIAIRDVLRRFRPLAEALPTPPEQ